MSAETKSLLELFTDASKWTQRYYAKNADGIGRLAGQKDAVCWCLTGGIIKTHLGLTRGKGKEVREKLSAACRARLGAEYTTQHEIDGISPIVMWNDKPERKFQDIVDIIKETGV